MIKEEYECALSGLTAEGIPSDDSDGLGSLPAGWTEIRIRRRQYNPKWIAIQQVKEQMVGGILSQLPSADLRALQELNVRVQIDANFYALEQDTPMFLTDVEDVVFISDSPDIVDSVNEIRAQLSLASIPAASVGEGEEADGDEEEEADEDEDTSDEEPAAEATT